MQGKIEDRHIIMISRRRFVQSGAVGAAAVAASAVAQAEKLPGPIAALKSMKGQARPIALQERDQRQ